MISAVIFDMDGLLLDSEVYWATVRTDYSASEGCAWTHEDELSVKGLNSPEWAAVIQRRCGLSVSLQQIIDGVSDRMARLYSENLPILPGAVKVVREIAALYPVGLASSSPPSLIEYALRAADIRSCFSAVVSADEVGKGKPSPDVFLVTADRLAQPPETCAVFEDSTAGIEAAHAARMHVFAVPNSHYPPTPDALATADVVLGSLLDFHAEMLTRM